MIFKEQIAERYSSVFGDAPTHIVRSLGRINIIGEHTDYNEGFVLPTAIDKAIYVGVGERKDVVIRLYGEGFEEYFEVPLGDIYPVDNGWPDDVHGVVNQFVLRGYAVGRFDLDIDGVVPLGACLSSQAALE